MPKLQDAIVVTPSHPNTNMADWQTKPLGEVCSLISRGISPKYLDDGGIRVLNQRCIRDHGIDWSASRRHNDKEKQVASDRLLQFGDGLINSTGTGTLGRVAQVVHHLVEPTTVDSHITIVRPKAGLFHPEFLGYMLIDIEDQLKDSGEGCGGQTELARSDVAEKFMVRFPSSIKEQQRIVTILDEAFEGIATAKANAEKSLEDSRALFSSYLHHLKGPKRALASLVSIRTGKLDANAAVNDGIYPFFTCSREVYAINTFAFDCHAILLAGNNAVGDFNVKIYNGKFNAYQRTYVITIPDENQLSHRYLYYQILKSMKEFKQKSVGAGTKFLKLGMIEGLEIVLPAVAEQESIVDSLDRLFQETQRLEGVIRQKQSSIEELRQSLLQNAFSGNL